MAGLIVHERRFAEIDPAELYAILRLRVDVFVVEQACPYPELDGRDVEPTALHLWIADDAGGIATYLRLLDDGADQRIGRVVTAPSSRGTGLGARLLAWTLARHPTRPTVLDAQAHLVGYYARQGFVPDGPEFIEDGIPHVPMRRPPGRP